VRTARSAPENAVEDLAVLLRRQFLRRSEESTHSAVLPDADRDRGCSHGPA